MSEEMFDALLAIMDAKIKAANIRLGDIAATNAMVDVDILVDEFKEKFVVREDD
jgi:hypothetical protein